MLSHFNENRSGGAMVYHFGLEHYFNFRVLGSGYSTEYNMVPPDLFLQWCTFDTFRQWDVFAEGRQVGNNLKTNLEM